jgi:hypothetical protein
MLQQNYQKLISSQGAASSKVLAAPNKQNFRYKYYAKQKKKFISIYTSRRINNSIQITIGH